MTISSKLKHLHTAFNEMGYECKVEPTDNPDQAAFTIDNGDAAVEFTAQALERRGLAALLRSHAHVVHIKAEETSMSVPFGHKNPDREKHRFFMTGLKRSEGDCPVEHHQRLEARKLARDLKQKLDL